MDQKARQASALQARKAAEKRLFELHADEFHRFVREERQLRGLSPEPNAKAQTIKEMRERYQRAELLLAEHGIETP
jgi:hypothetical protein